MSIQVGDIVQFRMNTNLAKVHGTTRYKVKSIEDDGKLNLTSLFHDLKVKPTYVKKCYVPILNSPVFPNIPIKKKQKPYRNRIL